MLSVHNILDEEGKRGVEVFNKCIEPYKATGKTQASAYYKVAGSDTKTTLEIDARGYVKVLETGSRPAKTKKPSREMVKEMEEYTRARGLPKSAAYPMAVVLLRDGQKQNRNVYSQQMDKFSDEVADRVLNEFAGYAVDKIVKGLQ